MRVKWNVCVIIAELQGTASYSLNLKSITLFKKIIFVHLVSLDLKYFPIKDLMAAFTDIFSIRVARAREGIYDPWETKIIKLYRHTFSSSTKVSITFMIRFMI